MPRTMASAEEIREIIQARIRSSQALDGACRYHLAPFLVALENPDSNGCNWSALPLPKDHLGCVAVIREIIEGVKAKYNLQRTH